MSAFSNAIAGALATIRKVAGDAVTYTRGEELEVELTNAVMGSSDFVGVDAEQVQVTARTIDWIVAAAELVFEGEDDVFLPVNGDQIQHTAGGKTHTYEVQPAADDEVWRYSDEPVRTTIRIHTKLVGVT